MIIYSTANVPGQGGPGGIAKHAIDAITESGMANYIMAANVPSNLPGGMGDHLHDAVSALVLPDEAIDIYHGFNNASYFTMLELINRDSEAWMIIERASTHPDHQMEVLKGEFERFGVKRQETDEIAHKKMLKEYRICDMILVPSQVVWDTMAKRGLEDALHMIEFGSDPERFHPSKVKKKHPFTVLYIGPSWMRKGLYHLEQAWEKLRLHDGPILKVNMPPQLRLPGITYKRIRKMGWLRDEVLPSVYRSADVFCLPSFEEGQVIAVWEALASGLPCIITEACGHPRVAEEKAGLIVEPGDVEGIKEAIRYYYENPSEVKAHGRNARKLAESRTWEDYKKDLIKLWGDVGE
ncbi:MAG: glycosyltransferase family 4 protein [Thermoplasmata archaeon]